MYRSSLQDTSEFVKPENLEKMFLYQELLGRGLKAWKKKNQR